MNIFRKSEDRDQAQENMQTTTIQPAPARQGDAAQTVISSGIAIKGDVTGRGAMRIEGTVTGNVTVEGDVTVAAGADVTGDIQAASVTIAGTVHGNISSRKLEIAETGKIWGDLRVERLLQREGGYHNGRSEMPDEGGPAQSPNA